MKIIVKYILKNMKEKKFRTFMLLFSITLSSALFFAAIAISGTIESMYMERMEKYFGKSELMVTAGKNSPSEFFSPAPSETLRENMEYIAGEVRTSAFYKAGEQTEKIDLVGVNLEDIGVMSPFKLEAQSDLKPFTGKKIIISKRFSDKYGISPGDWVELEVNGARQRFQTVGIAYPAGPFLEFSGENIVMAPRETIGGLFNSVGSVNVLYFKLKDPQSEQDMTNELSKLYPRYTVRETVTEEEIAVQKGNINSGVLPMVVAVFLVSIFIIYTSFKIISIERLPAVGTFRSIGATKRMTNLVLLGESLSYGTIGGVLACALGMVVLYMMTLFLSIQMETGGRVPVRFNLLQMLMTFAVALLVSFISSIIPVLKVSRLPLKDLVLNRIETRDTQSMRSIILGAAFLASGVAVPYFVPFKLTLFLDTACMALLVVAVVLLVPLITKTFVRWIRRLCGLLFGNEGILAAKNLKDNKSLLSNITLLAIGLSCLFLVSTTGKNVLEGMTDVYRGWNFDVYLSMGQADMYTENMLHSIEGVEQTYGVYAARSVEISGTRNQISLITGVDSSKHLDFMNVKIDRDREGILRKLDTGRYIMLTNTLKKTLSLKEGEILPLNLSRGRINYTILGFFNDSRNMGNYAIVSEKYLKPDTGARFYSEILIKAPKDPEGVRNAILGKLKQKNPRVVTVEQMKQEDINTNRVLFSLMNVFSVITLLIGVIGVINNFIISFIERKRSLAILRSIGMNKVQFMKMTVAESLLGGIVAGLSGVIAGTLLVMIIPHITETMGFPVSFRVSWAMYAAYVLAAAAITVGASAVPAVKSSKLSIIESIKYE